MFNANQFRKGAKLFNPKHKDDDSFYYTAIAYDWDRDFTILENKDGMRFETNISILAARGYEILEEVKA